MAYLGQVDRKASNIQVFNVASSTSATHNIGWTPPSEQTIIVTINGVKQHTNAYSFSGAVLTLSSALVTTDELEVIGINDIGNSLTPVDGSVTASKLGDDSVTTAKILDDNVTLAKMADGTQGDTLYYGAAGAPTLLAKPGTPAGEVLTFATSATAPSWVATAGGNTEFISAHTASSDASIEITSGFSSDYYTHLFKFDDLVPETDNVKLYFYLSEDGGSSYYTAGMYAVAWSTKNNTTGSVYNPATQTAGLGGNLAYAYLAFSVGNDADQYYSPCGELQIFKATDALESMWYAHSFFWDEANYLNDQFFYGTTDAHEAAVNAIKFQYSSGDFSGTVRFYGVKKT
jgi:uncharacterized protein (UPF0333 family)